jgi:3-phosphoshikimate 1-carboxyvinyltransferase
MGAAVEERPDGLVIQGGRPAPRRLASRRTTTTALAMALAVAAAHGDGETEIEGGACVAVSFPDFPDLVRRASR